MDNQTIIQNNMDEVKARAAKVLAPEPTSVKPNQLANAKLVDKTASAQLRDKLAQKVIRSAETQRLRNSPVPMAEIVRITPAMALALLEGNTTNRKLRPGKVALYADFMRQGKFMLNGEAICIANNGDLLNGQHRLAAIVDSAVPTETVVVFGLDPSVMDTYDTGTKRSYSDNLHIHGLNNTHQLAAAISWCQRYEGGTSLSTNNKSSGNVLYSDLNAWLDANPEIIEVVNWVKASRFPVRRGITATMLAGLIFEAKGLEDKAKEFITLYVTRVGLTERHPVITLMNWIDARQGVHKKVEPVAYNVALVKAFNAFAQDKTLQNIHVNPRKKADGTESARYNEEFPRIMTLDKVTKPKASA